MRSPRTHPDAVNSHSVVPTMPRSPNLGFTPVDATALPWRLHECGRRQCRLLAGKLYDDIYMDCLATEFISPVLAQLLAPDALDYNTDP